MDADVSSTAELLRALGNEHRLTILDWLSDPRAHFPAQRDGDLVTDGVCVGFITDKIGLSQPTVTNHLQYLSKSGLVTSKRIKNWAFYRLVPERVEEARAALARLALPVQRP
ncbi:ArsR/SmtB family transcription factor [Paracoccus sp. KR1-242]|uniref:ArsR/SmtB family transcription factor n=1 Tax=Paracoccus sp. KR1-242 TaxID=3410028 RepID=UPI003C0700AD